MIIKAFLTKSSVRTFLSRQMRIGSVFLPPRLFYRICLRLFRVDRYGGRTLHLIFRNLFSVLRFPPVSFNRSRHFDRFQLCHKLTRFIFPNSRIVRFTNRRAQRLYICGYRQFFFRIVHKPAESESDENHSGSRRYTACPCPERQPRLAAQLFLCPCAAEVIPKPLRLVRLIVSHPVVYIVQPIFFHSDMELNILYFFILSTNRALALCNCEAEVLSLIPSNSAISRWLFSSIT